VKILVRTGVAVAAVAALAFAPAVASAETAPPTPPSSDAPTLAGAQAELTARIDARLAVLASLTERVPARGWVTDAHKAALLAIYAHDTDGLTALKAHVAGDTTLDEVAADRESMIVDYRVFSIVVPQTCIVIKADRLAAIAAGTATAATKATRKTNRRADRYLKASAVDLTKAAAEAAAAADAALAVTPADWQPDGRAFAEARAHLHAAREALGLGHRHLDGARHRDHRHAHNCPTAPPVTSVPEVPPAASSAA
jgi:hypothetical protein